MWVEDPHRSKEYIINSENEDGLIPWYFLGYGSSHTIRKLMKKKLKLLILLFSGITIFNVRLRRKYS